MAEGTTAIDIALTTEGDADGSELIELGEGRGIFTTPSGPLQYVPNHEELGILQLAPPFWGKPLVAGLLQAFLREIQELEDTLWEMLELRTIEAADLPRLKVLGKIVGQPRLGFDTETYRLLIEARALANVSRGRASDILRVLNLLLGEADYELHKPGDATLVLVALDPVSGSGLNLVRQILPDVVAAGVGLHFISSAETGAGVLGFYPVLRGSDLAGNFIFDSTATPGVDATPMLGVTTL
ncbi:MAG: hypothetical protein RL685_4594 [Pseudomonadota bacterium]|jgi:hypothetical protein